jgi:aspartyl-tRNA(Asn)/glutamyl-tRNA(Gln) amidotransferase subunit C
VSVTQEEVQKIAQLARLHFSEEDLVEFTSQFQRILDYIEQLKQADVENIEPTSIYSGKMW